MTLTALTPEPLGGNVIGTLDRALEMAEKGEVSSVAVAIVLRDGRCQALWSDAPSTGTLLGSISRLAHKINLEIDE